MSLQRTYERHPRATTPRRREQLPQSAIQQPQRRPQDNIRRPLTAPGQRRAEQPSQMINRRQTTASSPRPHNMHRDKPRAQNANPLPSGKPGLRNRKDQDARALNLNRARPSSPSNTCGLRSPSRAWKYHQR
jgi:hypothetical protein